MNEAKPLSYDLRVFDVVASEYKLQNMRFHSLGKITESIVFSTESLMIVFDDKAYQVWNFKVNSSSIVEGQFDPEVTSIFPYNRDSVIAMDHLGNISIWNVSKKAKEYVRAAQPSTPSGQALGSVKGLCADSNKQTLYVMYSLGVATRDFLLEIHSITGKQSQYLQFPGANELRMELLTSKYLAIYLETVFFEDVNQPELEAYSYVYRTDLPITEESKSKEPAIPVQKIEDTDEETKESVQPKANLPNSFISLNFGQFRAPDYSDIQKICYSPMWQGFIVLYKNSGSIHKAIFSARNGEFLSKSTVFGNLRDNFKMATIYSGECFAVALNSGRSYTIPMASNSQLEVKLTAYDLYTGATVDYERTYFDQIYFKRPLQTKLNNSQIAGFVKKQNNETELYFRTFNFKPRNNRYYKALTFAEVTGEVLRVNKYNHSEETYRDFLRKIVSKLQ